MKILCFAVSLRKESFNKKNARLAAKILGERAEFIDLLDFPMPVYNQDIQDKGMPEGSINSLSECKRRKPSSFPLPNITGQWLQALKP